LISSFKTLKGEGRIETERETEREREREREREKYDVNLLVIRKIYIETA